MGQHFSLDLSTQEKDYLLNLAKIAIARTLKGSFSESDLPQPPPGGSVELPLGAFITLKKNGNLRGCIGRLQEEAPLYLTVARMARAAAFNDPRFPPLQETEFPDLELDVSIMGPITACKTPEAIEIGKHGLIIKQAHKQGLLLPQVPVEWKWDREQFLAQTCNKAGLPLDTWHKAWKNDGVELYWFEAVVL